MTAVSAGRSRRAYGEANPQVEQIVDAAVRIIDARGLPALTLRSLAAELDSFTANLYRRIDDREQVLDLVYAQIVDEASVAEVPESLGWQHRLRAIAVRLHAAFNAHPEAIPLLTRQRSDALTDLVLVDIVAGELTRAGLPEDAQLAATALYFDAVLRGIRPVTPVTAGYNETIAALTQTGEFPHAVRLRKAGAELQRETGSDFIFVVFMRQVDLVLRAIAASVSAI